MTMRALSAAFLALTVLVALPAHAEAIYGKVYDTLKGKIYPNTRVVLGSDPQREVITEQDGSFWFRDVKPGAYIVRIFTPDREVVGRLVVYKTPTTISNLDLAKIDVPGAEDEY
jgi:Carboxypeptidase regulatory-like domain